MAKCCFLPSDLPERTERLRGQQIVTRPEENERPIAMSLNNMSDQCALANPGLAPNQDDLSPMRPDSGHEVGHQPQLGFPLKQHEPEPTLPTSA